jgi:hypothetical protein
VELQRLIIEDAGQPLALDVHPRLTVVFHDDPRVRARLVRELVDGLGPSRDGVHLELTLGSGQPLVLFRARGASHRAIDPVAGRDVTPAFYGTNGSVDLLGRLGLPPPAARRTLRLSADDFAATNGSPIGEPEPLVRHLAGLDQRVLWETAEQVTAAEDRLDEAVGRDAAGQPASRQAAVERADRLRLALEAHRRVGVAARAHRGVLLIGGIVGGACALVAILLLLFDNVLDDDGWTSKALFVLAVLALAVAGWDRRTLAAARREERELLASLGAPSLEALQVAAGPWADPTTRRNLADAAAGYEPLAERWKLISGGAPLEAALAQQAEVERVAGQHRSSPSEGGAAEPAGGAAEPPGAVELLRRRVSSLAQVGVVRERLPLVLDDPFTNLDPADAVRLLDTLEQLSQHHQVVLVSGDAEVLTWSLPRAASGALGLVRLESGSAPGPS